MFTIGSLASMGSESEEDEEGISMIGLTNLDDSFLTQVVRINKIVNT